MFVSYPIGLQFLANRFLKYCSTVPSQLDERSYMSYFDNKVIENKFSHIRNIVEWNGGQWGIKLLFQRLHFKKVLDSLISLTFLINDGVVVYIEKMYLIKLKMMSLYGIFRV